MAPLPQAPGLPVSQSGALRDGERLKQGMRVAFSGDTSVERDLLEDRAVEAGLHVATSLSRLTSLLVTNDPDSGTSKTVKARQYGTPVVDEAAFDSCCGTWHPRTRRRRGERGPRRRSGADGRTGDCRATRLAPARPRGGDGTRCGAWRDVKFAATTTE